MNTMKVDDAEITFRMVGHACVIATYRGASILFDPWFGSTVDNGVFTGYPDFVPPTPAEIESLVGIHVSHIHYDHFRAEDLTHIRKDLPLFISRYQRRDLFHTLVEAGFSNIVEIPFGIESVQAGPFELRVFAKSPEDGSFDSSCVLSVGSNHFYFANDCIHPDSFYFTLRQLFGEFAGVFAGYAVANGYTWGTDFSECEDFKFRVSTAEAAKLRQRVGWDHVGRLARLLKARWVVPYASSYRFFSRDLAAKNSFFGTDEQIYDVDLGDTLPVVLKHGESISALGPVRLDRRPPTSPEIPEALYRPNLFNRGFDDSKIDSLKKTASGFFFEVYSRAARKWRVPMSIELIIQGATTRRSCFYSFEEDELKVVDRLLTGSSEASGDAVADVSFEFPASVVADIVSGKVQLVDAYSFFCIKAKWRRYKHGQTLFISWV